MMKLSGCLSRIKGNLEFISILDSFDGQKCIALASCCIPEPLWDYGIRSLG